MENIEITNEDFLSSKKEKKYNDICSTAMINIFQMTGITFSRIEQEPDLVIPICDFDYEDPEHQFVLSAARALGGVVGLQVAVDINPIRIWWMNRKLPKNCRLLHLKKRQKEHALNPNDLLSFMRPWAIELCGNDFSFGDIYYEFYATGGKTDDISNI